MKGKLIRSIFWAIVAVFIIIIGTMFAGTYLADYFPIGYIVIPVWVIFAGLGVTLIVLTLKRKVERVLKTFLLLTGSFAAGFVVFVLLHNLVSVIFNVEEAFFLILATIICLLGFLVGAIGTIMLAIRKRPTVSTGTS